MIDYVYVANVESLDSLAIRGALSLGGLKAFRSRFRNEKVGRIQHSMHYLSTN